MGKTVFMNFEASGCMISCLHCAANGGNYKSISLSKIQKVIPDIYNECKKLNIEFAPWFMHEVLAHPDALELLRLTAEYSPGAFEVFTTNCIPLAVRSDWQDLLNEIKNNGTQMMWVSFHGVGDVHDKIVNRKGAYHELLLALERIDKAGLKCGCNIFVTKPLIQQFDQFTKEVGTLGMVKSSWEIAAYTPSVRHRMAYEQLRPEIRDIIEVKDAISGLSDYFKDTWDSIEKHTEAQFYQKAVNEDMPDSYWLSEVSPDDIYLTCTNSLDIYWGKAGTLGEYYGNIEADGIEAVLSRALQANTDQAARIHKTSVECYFTGKEIPPIKQAALQYGNPEGAKVHFNAPSMVMRWLDLALESCRKY